MQALWTISKFQEQHSNIFIGVKIKGGGINKLVILGFWNNICLIL